MVYARSAAQPDSAITIAKITFMYLMAKIGSHANDVCMTHIAHIIATCDLPALIPKLHAVYAKPATGMAKVKACT